MTANSLSRYILQEMNLKSCSLTAVYLTPEIRLKLLFNPKIRQIYDKHRYFYKKSEKILSYTICRHKAVQFINIKDKNPCSKPVLMNFASNLLNLTLY